LVINGSFFPRQPANQSKPPFKGLFKSKPSQAKPSQAKPSQAKPSQPSQAKPTNQANQANQANQSAASNQPSFFVLDVSRANEAEVSPSHPATT
jgi:hypothetical protein